MSFFHSKESGVFSNVKNPFNNFLFVGQVPLVEVGLLELVAGVSILRYINISILIKYSNFSNFIKKNWVHFIKNPDVISLVIDQSEPKMH